MSIEDTVKDRILKAVEDALDEVDDDDAVRFSLGVAQKLIDEDDEPVFRGSNSEGATVEISVLPPGRDFYDVVLKSKPQNVADIFWYKEADCWRSQADLILALEGSLNSMKAKFVEHYGFPAEREVLVKEAQEQFPQDKYPLATHRFWPEK